MARPTKLNAEVQETIVSALKNGNYFDVSCQSAGIDESTGYNWMARGRKESERREGNVKVGTKQWDREQPFIEFFEAVTKASASVEIEVVQVVKDHIKDDWKAALAFLKARYPDKWGRRRHEHTGKDGDALKIEVEYIDHDDSEDYA